MNLKLYLLFAIFLILVLLTDFFCNKKTSAFFKWLLILVFCIFASNRALSVPDTQNYKNFFEDCFSPSSEQYGFEIAFVILTRFIRLFTDNFRIYFFIIAFLQMIIALNAFSDTKYKTVIFCLFISYYGLYFSFIILRAGFSILFFLCSLKSTRKGKQALFMILAILFHFSAIIALFFVLILKMFPYKKINLKNSIFITIVSCCLYFFSLSKYLVQPFLSLVSQLPLDNLLWNKFIYYITELKFSFFDISYRFLTYIMIYLYWLFIISKYSSQDEKMLRENRLMLFSMILSGILGNNVIGLRILDFFYVIIPYLISDLIKINVASPILLGRTDIRRELVIGLPLLWTILNLIFVYRILV